MKVIAGAEEIELGTTETTPTIGIIDYSRRETDDFGVTTVVERGFARRLSVRLALPFDHVDGVQQTLAALRATSAIWVADDRFDWLTVEGFYKDFQLDLAVPPLSYCTLTVEGLAETETVTDAGADPAPDGKPSTLQLLKPVDVDGAVFVSSTVAETDYSAWATGTTYALGAHVIKTSTHRVYESLIAGNIGHDPAAGTGEWLDVGPTNRWAMFDQALGTATTAASPIVVVLAPEASNTLAVLDVTGSTVRVQRTGYDQTKAIGAGALLFTGLPGSGNVTVTVAGTGSVSVGTLLVGGLTGLGVTEASPSAGINDFSRKEVDEFGAPTIVERAWAKRMSARALISTDAVDVVANRIAGVRARPCLWLGDSGLDSLTVYGFFKDFSIEVGETVSILSLSIEGLSTAPPPSPPTTVDWTNVLDGDPVNHPKPDDGATDGATVGENIKNGAGAVLQPGLLLNSSLGLVGDGITFKLQYVPDVGQPPVVLATLAAPDLGAARASSVAQAQEALDAVSAALLKVQYELSRTREIMRDAGITVDRDTGQVYIHALDRSEERLNTVDLRLDAANAQILLRATTAYVDSAIALAVIDPTQVPVFTALEARISSAEVDIDALDAAVTLRATVVDVNAIAARVTTAESDISALTGIVSTKVSTTTFNALDTRVTAAESTLSAIGNTAEIADTVRVARLLSDNADAQDVASLMALLAGDDARRTQVAGLAEARRELTAKVVDDVLAEASQRVALAARVSAAEANIVSENTARATGDEALATSITALTADLDDEVAERAAAVTAEAAARASADGALASSVTAVATTVGNHTASIEAFSESIDGLLARAGIKLDVAGRVIGWILNNDGEEGIFAVLADAFRVDDPDGTAGFSIADGVLRIVAGSYKLLLGPGIGAGGNVVLWFGASSTADGSASIANSIFSIATDGKVYYGTTEISGGGVNAIWERDFAHGAPYTGASDQSGNLVFVPDGTVANVTLNLFAECSGTGGPTGGSFQLQFSSNGSSWSSVGAAAIVSVDNSVPVTSDNVFERQKTGLTPGAPAYFRVLVSPTGDYDELTQLGGNLRARLG